MASKKRRSLNDLPRGVPKRRCFGSAFFYGDAGLLSRSTVSGPKADYQATDLTLGLGAPIGGRAEVSFGDRKSVV